MIHRPSYNHRRRKGCSVSRVRCLVFVCLLAGAAGPLSVAAVRSEPSLGPALAARRARSAAGGRVTATGVPGEPNRFYFGAVGGGVWRSDNAGRTWEPIFDSQPIASIGAIAVAPSDPNVLYVGSGEADMRSDISYGNGMYKSVDGGKTWTRIGLADTRQIGRILVDPKDPNLVFVAALGHAYGPNPERGVFRSKDGGKTWSQRPLQGRRTPARSTSRSTRATRGRSSPPSGRRGGRPGTSTRPRTARAAASTARTTAATRGSRSRRRLSLREARPHRHRVRARRSAPRLRDRGREGGRPLRLARTAARPGSARAPTGASGSAAGTSAA